MNFSFVDQMEENVRFNLCYPYHMNRDKMLRPETVHPSFPDALHTHSFEKLLSRAYREPFAFYLTDKDKTAYSAQELEFIARVVAFEQERINNGQCLIDLDITDETMEFLLKYKAQHNMTFEEAVVDILTKIIGNPEMIAGSK